MPMSFFLIYMLIIWHFKALEKTHSEMEHPVLEHMHKKLDVNRTKIKGGCQSGRKVVTHTSKSDLPLLLAKAHF